MHDLVFGPRAFEDLDDIHRYVTVAADYDVADTYQARIVSRCRVIADAPLTGAPPRRVNGRSA